MQALISLDTDDINARYKQLKESLINQPDNIDLLYATGLIEDKLGLTNEALAHYQRALNLSPQDEDVLKNTGLLYLKIGKAQEAKTLLLRAASIKPDNDEVTLALGKTYDALGEYRNALQYYLQLENINLGEVDVRYYIAMTYGKLNNQGESHYYFGVYFKKMKRKDSALFHFKEALRYFSPDSPRTIVINQEIKELNKK
jgi:tetratricopeptide (TPR) repeat protein